MNHSDDGSAGSQNPHQLSLSGQGAYPSTGQSPSAPRKLWTFKDYADFLGVSQRYAAELESQGQLAEPVMLGPRLKRYIPEECEAKVKELPRAVRGCEPLQLADARRARIDRMKATGTAA